ncbi:MAG: hypothetical protein WAM82_11825 [Thermoanaerobaculia bacterium]
MRLTGITAAFVVHEVRTQWRSLRFRVLAAACVLAGGFPAALIYARHQSARITVGSATYAAEVFDLLPVLTAVVALLISIDAVTREQDEGSWSTASLAGMSSAGYLLRRWLALQAVLLPLTAVPVAVAGVAAAAALGPANLRAGPLLGPWLMHVVPIALAFSALGLGLGTIAGGMINAFLLGGVVLGLVPLLVNAALGRFGIRLGGDWLQIPEFAMAIKRITTPYVPADPWTIFFPLEMSESPWDWRVAAEQYLPLAALPVALAAATLGLAVRHLRRTRPDVRPLRIGPDHSLRNFLLIVARLRERYTSDPRPSRADLVALGTALLIALAGVALLAERAEHYQRLGTVRFAMETAGKPDPTPTGVMPGRWRLEGVLGPGREVALTVTAEMRNLGTSPQGHLAFTLNPHVRVEAAAAGEGTLELSRVWDRLGVDVSPPIPPGGARELRFRLRGEPAEDRFFSARAAYWGFHKTFGDHLHARFWRDLADLSKGYQVPALSPRRIELQAADLTPVPRYQTWKLYADEENPNILRMPQEVFFPAADLSLDLAAPPGVLVADSCGGLVSPGHPGSPGSPGRLRSHCRLAVSDLTVAGGHYRELPRASATGATVAVLPFHAALGELHLGFLAQGISRLDEAWPGLGDLRQTVVLEWPSDEAFGLDAANVAYMNRWADPGRAHISVQGELVRMTEMDLIRTETLKPDTLVAELVAGRLARRRPAKPDDALLVRMLLRSLVLQRLGIMPDGGAAVMGVRTGTEALLSIPPPESSYSLNYWNNRFPALVTALRYRMGEEALRGAIEDVLSRTSNEPLTREELYAAIEKRSEVPVDRMIQDFLVQGYLPQPILDGVELHHSGGAEGGWRVTGRMRNRTQGEALCKVVLNTDLGRLETTVRADHDQAGDFSFSTPRRPQAVLLDPDRECHRLIPSAGARDRVFFDGAER